MLKLVPVALLVAAVVTPANAQVRVENALRDGIVGVEHDNPEMAKAFARARETLPGFFAALEHPTPRTGNFSVKIGVATPRGTEYIWIGEPTRANGRISGRIDNAPRWTDVIREGEMLTFNEEEIVDWLYIDNGMIRGNFTSCAMNAMSSAPEAAAMAARFRMTCAE